MSANGHSVLHVGIDNISPGSSSGSNALGGMRHFVRGLASHLPARAPQHLFNLFTPVWSEPFDVCPAPNLRVTVCRGVPRRPAGRVFYEQLRLPARLRREAVALWLATCNTLPIRWTGPSVLIVQSLQYLTHPEAFPWLRRTYLRRVVLASLHRATRLVTFSTAAKADIVNRAGVADSKIAVIPHAVRFAIDEAAPLEDGRTFDAIRKITGDDYVLCVSAFYGYKNLFRLLEAFARIKPRFPHKLVLAGAETPAVSREDLVAAAAKLGVAGDLVFLGRVSDPELATVYRHAALMTMPSLEETFGLPVLEAMALGCPVVTSNVSSMPEIAGDAAMLVNPYDTESVAEGLQRVLSGAELRQRMSIAGRARARSFTYDRFFASLLDVIDAAAAER